MGSPTKSRCIPALATALLAGQAAAELAPERERGYTEQIARACVEARAEAAHLLAAGPPHQLAMAEQPQLRQSYEEARKLAGEYGDLRVPGKDLTKVDKLNTEVLVTDKEIREGLQRIEQDLHIENYTESVNRNILRYLAKANSLRARIDQLYRERGDPAVISKLHEQLKDINERIGFEFYTAHDVDLYLDYVDRYLAYKEAHPGVSVKDQEVREGKMQQQLGNITSSLRERVAVSKARMLLYLWGEEKDAGRKAALQRELDKAYAALPLEQRPEVTDPQAVTILDDQLSRTDRRLRQSLTYEDPELFGVDGLIHQWKLATPGVRPAIELQMETKVRALQRSQDPDVRAGVAALEKFLKSRKDHVAVDTLEKELPVSPFPGILLHADQLIKEIDNLRRQDPQASIEKRRELIPGVHTVMTELLDRHAEAMMIAHGREHVIREFAMDTKEAGPLPSKTAEGLVEGMRQKSRVQIERMLGALDDMENRGMLRVGAKEHVEHFWVKQLRPRIFELMKRMDWLYGKVEVPEKGKSTKEVIEAYNKETLRKAREDFEVAQIMLGDKDFVTEDLATAPTELPPEGTRITKATLDQYRGSPAKRKQAILILYGQIEDDLHDLADQNLHLMQEFGKVGEASDKAQAEAEKAGEQAQENMRDAAWRMLKWLLEQMKDFWPYILGAAAVILWWKTRGLRRRWRDARRMRGLERQVAGLEADKAKQDILKRRAEGGGIGEGQAGQAQGAADAKVGTDPNAKGKGDADAGPKIKKK